MSPDERIILKALLLLWTATGATMAGILSLTLPHLMASAAPPSVFWFIASTIVAVGMFGAGLSVHRNAIRTSEQRPTKIPRILGRAAVTALVFSLALLAGIDAVLLGLALYRTGT